MSEQQSRQDGGAPALPNDFSKLNKADKWGVARYWVCAESGQFQPNSVKSWIMQGFYRTAKGLGSKQVLLRSNQLVFTCQGDWGLLDLPADLSPSPNLETLCEQLREVPAVLKLWQRVRKEAASWGSQLGVDDLGCVPGAVRQNLAGGRGAPSALPLCFCSLRSHEPIARR